ncbi:hypothetical protein ACTHQ6_10300 [Arthrobacter sp. SAFR-179]|uniref:hypothetical protein n=1 Tax=Arthrobacter sp. SAFR-179 TaxID=3387279 RepID=UPI003F7CC917
MNDYSAQLAFDSFNSEINDCRDLRSAIDNASGVPLTGQFLVYESILLRSFRAVETALGAIFTSYLLGDSTLAGAKVESCLVPRDKAHVDQVLLGSGSNWVDWSDARTVRERSGIFFKEDNPIELSLGSFGQQLGWMKILRNHVAHNSTESMNKYIRALESILTAPPVTPPTVGEFLASRPTKGAIKGREVLSFFLDYAEKVIHSSLEYSASSETTSKAQS